MKAYLTVTCILFALVGLLHLVRLINQTPVQFGATPVPMAVSFGGLPLALGLAAWAARLLRGR